MEQHIRLAACAMQADALNKDNTQHVHLIAVDDKLRIVGQDGRQWLMDDEAIMQAASKQAVDLPVDYHHASLDAEVTGAPAPAAGWILAGSLHIEEDGLWGNVRWTEQAAQAIRDKQYKYISPVFAVKDGAAVRLIGAGLTHYPNLTSLHPVANRQHKENAMDELLERLRYMLNLPALATAEEIKAELDKGFAMLKGKLGEAAANAERLDELAACMTQTAGNASGGDFVPRAEFDRVAGQLRHLNERLEQERVEAAVNAALEAGVIAPASLAWARDYCRKDAEGFAQFCANSAKVIPLGEEQKAEDRGQKTEGALSAEELAVCKQLGVNPEAFAKTKEGDESWQH